MISCNECGKRINELNAIKINNSLVYYCKKCYERLFEHNEDNCHFCEHFHYSRNKLPAFPSVKPFFKLLNGCVTGRLGHCDKHDKHVTTLSEQCSDYKYAFKTERYCSKEHIIHDCAVNDDCRRADFDCDKCFTKEHWENDVLKRIDEHVIGTVWSDGQQGVDYYTHGEGGYYDRRFDLHFEDGEIIEDVGLWSRGRVPNERVSKKLRHAQIISRG